MAKKLTRKKKYLIILLSGIVFGIVSMFLGNKYLNYTSTNEYCMSCHIHPEADASWKLSYHYNTNSGVVVNCVDCHLPPKGSFNHLWVKGTTGLKDFWSYHTKDSASFDWQHRKQLEYASKIVFNESCEKCHQNLFTKNLSSEGALAHLYYEDNKDKLNLQCINCHLDAGHYDPNHKHSSNYLFGTDESTPREIFDSATAITGFNNFMEKIPGTSVSFNMLAINGGTFQMGSADNEPFRNENEGPVRTVTVDPFYMGELEVTWDEYLAFFNETKTGGRISQDIIKANNLDPVDGISGPTAPYGSPDQGWGYGQNPAITMTFYAAQTYCQWLSEKTGKTYRLPTEAEWEYAVRGNTTTSYFFEGSPKKFTRDRWWNRVFGVDTAVINTYAIYEENSNRSPKTGSKVEANPFGLKNMLGNVMEYCSDWYAPDAYSQLPEKSNNPTGPTEGTERVVRGGSFSSDAKELRSAFRDHTRTDEWLKTDPTSPKSMWWLSDCTKIGFRVVCESN